jgi:amino acid adenylation domain-containing protein
VKVSNFRLIDDELAAVVDFPNRTDYAYDRDATVLDLIERRAAETPLAIAVRFEESAHTYAELWSRSNRVAQSLLRLRTFETPIAGVLMDDTFDMLVALLGVMKARFIYLPANPELPLERTRFMFADAPVSVLLTERKYIREANRLQWECARLRTVLCIDSLDVLHEPEAENELMKVELWNWVGDSAGDDIAAGGWQNSYDGADFSREEMEEYGANAFLKLAPLLDKAKRVLEIGCSSGITMFRLAPLAGFYYGIDLSESILARTRRDCERFALGNVRLECRRADEIDRIDERDFDLVVINSVIQNWNGHNYLRDVLRKVIPLLRERGHIFIGDVMDLERKDALLRSLTDFQREHGRETRTKTDWSHELFLARAFWDDLACELPEIARVEHSEKIATIRNELTEFRYDTLLTIAPQSFTSKKKTKLQLDWSDIALEADDVPRERPCGDDLAYILYTSGTTGRPKGVAVGHRSLHNYIAWAARHYFGRGGGSMPLFTSPAFDLTLTSIFTPLILGQSIAVYRASDIDRLLLDVFTNPHIDAVKLTPAHIAIVRQLELAESNVRLVIAGGEDLLPEHVRTLRALNPSMEIYNEYGPTEATVGCTIARVEEGAITIGVPIDNAQVYVLGANGDPQPVGAAGELCVAGDCLALGYWNDPELTRAKFIEVERQALSLSSPAGGGPGAQSSTIRLYRTGDLARWLPNGNLLLLGRVDHQVKIRGTRIELGEIESALRGIAGIDDALVIDKTDAAGDKCLCAYLIPTVTLNRPSTALTAGSGGEGSSRAPREKVLRSAHDDGWMDRVRQELARVFPEFMIPSYFVALDAFPLSANGKVDRKALPEPAEIAAARGVAYAAPENELQREIANVWQQVLRAERVGIDDNFFEIGGHSLKATQIVARLHRRLGVEIALKEVFRHPTIRALAAAIEGRARRGYEPIPSAPPAELYDVSHAQARLWLLQNIEREPVAYNVIDAVRIDGPLNLDALREALRMLVARYEILRTTFVEVDGRPKQRVHPPFDVEIGSRAENAPFDLGVLPLFRVSAEHVADAAHVVTLTMHHIITDGWSSAVMTRQLLRLYRACAARERVALPPLRIQYKDFAAWQNRLVDGADEQRAWWQERLAPPLPLLDLPMDRARPAVKTFAGGMLPFTIDAETTTALQRIARERGASLFMVLLAVVKTLLFRWSGQEDVIVGSPIAGRTHPDLEEQLGFFTNTLALRTRIDAGGTFLELVERVKTTALEAFEHQLYPFDRLVGELALPRDTSRTPLFDVLFALQNNDRVAAQIEGLTVTPLALPSTTSKFDLSVHASEEGDALAGAIEYSSDLFSPERAARIREHLVTLAADLARNPQQKIAHANLISSEERRTLDQFAGPMDRGSKAAALTSGGASLRVIEQERRLTSQHSGLIASFDDRADAHPERVAITHGDEHVTYAELQAQSRAIAASVTPGTIVTVSLPRSPALLATFVGILRGGGVYAYIDPALPAERRRYMEQRCAATVSREAAYVVFTSGSTGRPKGVVGTHRCLANLMAWQTRTIGEGLRSAFYAALGFDVAVQEMLFAVTSGGTLVIPNDDERLDPKRLTRFLDEQRVELLTMPFSALALLFADDVPANALASLRHLITSGEQLHVTQRIRRFLERRRDVALHNQYGPSETHVVTSETLRAGERAIEDFPSIGKPIDETRAWIVDAQLRPVPIGVRGELVLGGANVALGYLGNDEPGAERFLDYEGESAYRTGDLCSWREDGSIDFHGRIDHQVKIRGYRVEPAEVEQALLDTALIEQACVVARDGALIAYVTERSAGPPAQKRPASIGGESPAVSPAHHDSLDAGALRMALGRTLPDYMIPARFVRVERFPKTSTGKIDRRRLAAEDGEEIANVRAAAEPSTETERFLLALWQQLLGRDDIGVDDDFFASGGHSILATQLIARIRGATALEPSLIAVLRRPTIRSLARHLDELRDYRGRHEQESWARLNAAHEAKLFALPPVLGYGVAFQRLAERLDGVEVNAFDFIEHHALLAHYASVIAQLQPDGAIVLFGYSAGGSLAFELAQLLESRGRVVSDILFLDTFRPSRARASTEAELRAMVVSNLDYFDEHMRRTPELRILTDNPDLRELTVRKMSSYFRFYESLANAGEVGANLHLITSDEFADDPRHELWRDATRARFTIHRGAGPHTDMLLGDHVETNARVITDVLRRARGGEWR